MRVPLGDRVYRLLITACAASIPLVLTLLAAYLLRGAWPVLASHGAELVTGVVWDVPHNRFGALPVIGGTVLSSLMALVIATPLAVAVAILSAELAPRWLQDPLAFVVNLLAAIPSVVYGLWGIFVLLPFLQDRVMPSLIALSGNAGILRGPAYGPSLLAAGLLLAIMILPFIAGVTRDVLMAVPRAQREAALALGATRWEMVRDAVLPSAQAGIFGGVMLGLGRALGETMAVTMVIGNRHALPSSLLDPAYTMSALLANEFAEASSSRHLAALLAVAALLLLVTLLVNLVARWLIGRVAGAGTSVVRAT